MPIIRKEKQDFWMADKVIIEDKTKEKYIYKILRDCSWNIMTKEQWDSFKKEIDSFYEKFAVQEIVAMDEKINYNNKMKKHKKTKGYVYLIQSNDGFIKIGRTINIKKRFKTLSVHLPYKIRLLGIIETNDYIGLEEELHCKYAEKRVNGEWFKLNENEINELLKLVNV